MNVNNFNPFERHVEKIALAVAAVAAGYMIYLAWPPMLTIQPSPGSPPLAADQVEPQVSAAVKTLEDVREATRQLKLRAEVDDFVAIYQKEMQDQPLPPVLVDAGAMPTFVPRNIAVGTPESLEPQQNLPIATPTVPDPTEPSAQSYRGVFALVPPVAAGPGAPPPPAPGAPLVGPNGAPVPTEDKDMVLVRGLEDTGAFLRQMADPDLPAGQHLPLALQRAVITKVELQRRERQGSGWSSFVDVPPSTASTVVDVDWSKVADPDLQTTLTGVEQQFKQIAQPEYFPLANGGSVVQQLIGGATGASGGVGGAGGVPGAPGGMTPFPPAPGSAAVPAPAPGGAPGAAVAPQVAPPEAIWAIDDHVEPGKEYQYQIRVSMYNPTYRWPHALKQPEMKDQPILTSGWVLVPNSVEVQSNMYFFIMGPIGRGAEVSARVYKWNMGRWFVNDVSVEPGVPITANIKMPNGAAQDVVTQYTVVDVVPVGNDVNVVLMDPNGNLVTRLASADRASKTKEDIDNQIASATPPVVPATRPSGGPRQPLFPPSGRTTPPGTPPGETPR